MNVYPPLLIQELATLANDCTPVTIIMRNGHQLPCYVHATDESGLSVICGNEKEKFVPHDSFLCIKYEEPQEQPFFLNYDSSDISRNANTIMKKLGARAGKVTHFVMENGYQMDATLLDFDSSCLVVSEVHPITGKTMRIIIPFNKFLCFHSDHSIVQEGNPIDRFSILNLLIRSLNARLGQYATYVMRNGFPLSGTLEDFDASCIVLGKNKTTEIVIPMDAFICIQ